MTWRELGFREKNIKMIKCRERRKKKKKKRKMSRLIHIIDTQEKSSKKIIIILFFTKRVRYTIIYLIESKKKAKLVYKL